MRTPLPNLFQVAVAVALVAVAPSIAACRHATSAEERGADAVRPVVENPVELGRVRWSRDLDAALAEARAQGKPLFALFQEIPGCSTCVGFGEGPLCDPLLVEAIEELFVPVAIYNNREGEDARVLERFGEPSWNNPVVRFLDGDGEDVIARRDRVWSTADVARRAVAALEAAGRAVPDWLTTVAPSAEVGELEEATFTMACFWSGEAALGAVPGVVATRAVWVGGREGVAVRFDPAVVDGERLAREAERSGCAASSGPATRDAAASDDKHALDAAHRLLPLTPMQRTKVNAALARGRDPGSWLSPRQVELLARVRRALAADAEALSGLRAPASLGRSEERARYAAELEARLATLDGAADPAQAASESEDGGPSARGDDR